MKHREAYCLMNYRCEACGAEEVLGDHRPDGCAVYYMKINDQPSED